MNIKKEAQKMGIINLNRIFHPQAVAVIGASDNPGYVGSAIMENLKASGFAGDVFPVNHGAPVPELPGGVPGSIIAHAAAIH